MKTRISVRPVLTLAILATVLMAVNITPATAFAGKKCETVKGTPEADPKGPADCAFDDESADNWTNATACCDKLPTSCAKAKCYVKSYRNLCVEEDGEFAQYDLTARTCGGGSSKGPATVAPAVPGKTPGTPGATPAVPAIDTTPVVVENMGLLRVTRGYATAPTSLTLPASTAPALTMGAERTAGASLPMPPTNSSLPAELITACANGDLVLDTDINGKASFRCVHSAGVVATAGAMRDAALVQAWGQAWAGYNDAQKAKFTPPPAVVVKKPGLPWWGALLIGGVAGGVVEMGTYMGGSSGRTQAVSSATTGLVTAGALLVVSALTGGCDEATGLIPK